VKSPQLLLVFRFSALGDVAMTVPVVKSLLQQYPDLQVTYVSNAFVAPLFTGIERLHFQAADLKGRHNGIKGLFNLYRELSRTYNFDAIADLHNVLRTQILRFFFIASFKKIAVIDKGRKEKKELTRKEHKVFKPLKSTIQRYADVFAALGLPVQLHQHLESVKHNSSPHEYNVSQGENQLHTEYSDNHFNQSNLQTTEYSKLQSNHDAQANSGPQVNPVQERITGEPSVSSIEDFRSPDSGNQAASNSADNSAEDATEIKRLHLSGPGQQNQSSQNRQSSSEPQPQETFQDSSGTKYQEPLQSSSGPKHQETLDISQGCHISFSPNPAPSSISNPNPSPLYNQNPPLTSDAPPQVSSSSNSDILPSVFNTNNPSSTSNLKDTSLISGLIDPSLTSDLNDSSIISDSNDLSLIPGSNSSFLIGIAPFAQHAEKMYPHEKMKEVLRLLLQHQNIKVLLFGGGKLEVSLLQQWEKEIPGLESVAGKMSFHNELKLITQLDLMVSMDSANMHLASLSGIPVISIWGSTHPFAGFYGWGQSPDDAIQVDLYCRPCSVFGNRPCFRGDLACMNSISPFVVYNKIMEKVHKQKIEKL
jgi:ADP-heptose:LPS heptosyltransferase